MTVVVVKPRLSNVFAIAVASLAGIGERAHRVARIADDQRDALLRDGG